MKNLILNQQHFPGFSREQPPFAEDEATELFRSEFTALGFQFTVFFWPPSTTLGDPVDVGGYLDHTGTDWEISDPEQLADLGDASAKLSEWLDDCSEVLRVLREKHLTRTEGSEQ